MEINKDELGTQKYFNTPILFIVFNRPDCTQKVFNVIKEMKPRYLFISADGPRTGHESDKEKCEQVKQIIENGIDWDCEIKTLFRKENLGCGKAVSSAITWFFENIEQGIILEDDCLPDKSFFRFCEELLEKYKYDTKVSHISGFNFMSKKELANEASYFFSQYAAIWGWASWRRAWKDYDFYITTWKLKSFKQKIYNRFSFFQMLSIRDSFDAMYNQKMDTWDFQWWYLCLVTDTVGVVPTVNLIQNIGFNTDATHTHEFNEEISILEAGEILFPLIHNNLKAVKQEYDNVMFCRFHKQKASNIIKSIIKRALSLVGYNH